MDVPFPVSVFRLQHESVCAHKRKPVAFMGKHTLRTKIVLGLRFRYLGCDITYDVY